MNPTSTDEKLSRSQEWLKANKHLFGTHDGLPGEFHREVLFNQIKPHAIVAIVTPRGEVRQGRVVMKSRHGGWVLNLGGAHGNPGLVDHRNCVYVGGASLYAKKTAPWSGHIHR